MKTFQSNVLGPASIAVLATLLTTCSARPDQRLGSGVDELAAGLIQGVPDDAEEFQAAVSVDPAGNVFGRTISLVGGTPVVGFDPSALPRKTKETQVPREKISRGLLEKLRPLDSQATTEVVVSVAHDAPFSVFAKLQRSQPRTSVENTQRLASRAAQIAAVDSRRKPFRNTVIAKARALGAVVTEEFTMGNAIALTIPDRAVSELASDPNVLEVSAARGPTPPSTVAAGTSLATGMNSDFWRPWMNGAFPNFYVATLDTGVRSTHTVFHSPDSGALGLHRDCAYGNSSCLNSPVNPLYNDQDPVMDHGTPVASIIVAGNSSAFGFGPTFRGVSKVELDYYNVYSNVDSSEGLIAAAVLRAFPVAAAAGADLIGGLIQHPSSDAGAISLAADDAFDQGIAVVAACGNFDKVSAPAAPGNAHKALSIGDYNAATGAVVAQVPGVVDGRIKPDFQAPTQVGSASRLNDTAVYFSLGGTSGATAFATGAAALMYHWYNYAIGLSNKPGNLYTALLAQGDATSQPSIPNGSGKLKLESGSEWLTGQITLGSSAIDIFLPVPAGRKDLKVAIWWPERQSDAHDDVDLYVLNPANINIGWSISAGSVWEKVRLSGNLTPGSYKIRIVPYSMPRATQVVYYTAVMSYQ